MTARQTINVLFLCTGNSARSILCEAALNSVGKEKFKGFSAGSQPKDEVRPMTRKTLEKYGISAEGCRSKSWDEYSGVPATVMDFVETVCDHAAAEVCPMWPASQVKVHRSIRDPATVVSDSLAQENAFEQARRTARNAASETVKTVDEERDLEVLSRRLNSIFLDPHQF